MQDLLNLKKYIESIPGITVIISEPIMRCDNNGEEQYGELGPKELIRRLKIDDPNKLVIGHLNINSIRYKFECLCDIVANNIDILLISETRLNDSFPNGQFLMNGFQVPFRKDRTDKEGYCYLYKNKYHVGNSISLLNIKLRPSLLKLI